LQICPHDVAPFTGLCERYEQAGASIDAEVTTVFLAPPQTEPLPYAEYLGCENLQHTVALRKGLAKYALARWDLVVCHRYRPYWAVARSPLAANPVIVVAHEFGLLSRRQRRLNRRLFARNCCFAGVSEPVADELERVVGKAYVLPNVLDVGAAEAALLARAEALARLDLSPGPLTIGVVGRLHYKKRPQLALRAFQRLQATHPDSRLVFVGDGDREGLLAPGVHLAGGIPDAARLFNAFDVLLHPTQVEAFGMVVLEAMFAGVPVVTLRQGGPAHVLGELGAYAQEDTAEGFAAAMIDAARIDRDHLLGAGRERVLRMFSVSALGRALDHVLIDHPLRQRRV